jgi:hypothetical protein
MRSALTAVVVFVLGCGAAAPPPPSGTYVIELAPYPGWPAAVATRARR